MELFTIGFTQKSAKQFFNKLKENEIDFLLDVRLFNNSQHYGYAKVDTLKYILEDLLNIKYKHIVELAPSENLLSGYRTNKISWGEYESIYNNKLSGRDIKALIPKEAKKPCLLCAEPTAEKCHRRLAAEYIKTSLDDVSIKHL